MARGAAVAGRRRRFTALFAGTAAYLLTCVDRPSAARAGSGAALLGGVRRRRRRLVERRAARRKPWRAVAHRRRRGPRRRRRPRGARLRASGGPAARAGVPPVRNHAGWHRVPLDDAPRGDVHPGRPGFLRLRLRAPGWPRAAPGRARDVDRRTGRRSPRGRGRTNRRGGDIPAARDARTRAGFRRVDFRANQEWFEEVRLGRRTARRPVSLMVERLYRGRRLR